VSDPTRTPRCKDAVAPSGEPRWRRRFGAAAGGGSRGAPRCRRSTSAAGWFAAG